MEKQFTFDDLKRILVEGLGTPEDEVPHDLNATFHQLGFDSIDFVEIQRIVEANYGVTVDEPEAQLIFTFGDAIDFTNRRLQEKG